MKISDINCHNKTIFVLHALRGALETEGFEFVIDTRKALGDGKPPCSLKPYPKRIHSNRKKTCAPLREALMTRHPAHRALWRTIQPDPTVNEFGIGKIQYCAPPALQSMQMLFPAPHWREVFRIALARIEPTRRIYEPSIRRPDDSFLHLRTDKQEKEAARHSRVNGAQTRRALGHPGNGAEPAFHRPLESLAQHFQIRSITVRGGLFSRTPDLRDSDQPRPATSANACFTGIEFLFEYLNRKSLPHLGEQCTPTVGEPEQHHRPDPAHGDAQSSTAERGAVRPMHGPKGLPPA